MNDDLAYVSDRLPEYHSYGDEETRHDSDMRVRAYVGEALTALRTRLGGTLRPEANAALEKLLYHCMFADQHFVHAFEHAELDERTIAALVRSDRALVEDADRASTVGATDALGFFSALEARFSLRRSPEPFV